MGIPKFFRYISERYPLTSQLITENNIPEFDNLYLDFNAIIHNCSHPNDDDPHFRLTETQIFTSIFTYIEHLFSKIKPRKLFFLAVDGVAPRAKMNQQRSRRFRTALGASQLREKALAKGEVLPTEKAFDSNCITPGTPFMQRLQEQLRYFINKKISEDAGWQEVEVVLSGHEVPGEGEHKIMEYIRRMRAQPGYDGRTRHCLYGLDADLIMLGLVSHDPHFCLLREEVKFGPSSSKSKGSKGPEQINFYLLHICLLREYLDLEFNDVASSLSFSYDLERVIDDFVMLAVFVGNDFLPNLPDLHIHENGLEKLFDVYKKVLPAMGGYINLAGTINTTRLQMVLDEMATWEKDVFEKEYADLNWYKGKQAKHIGESEREAARKRNKLVLTRPQRLIFDQVHDFVAAPRSRRKTPKLTLPNTFPAQDRAFITTLASDLHLVLAWDGYDDEKDVHVVSFEFPEVGGEEEETNGPNGHSQENGHDNGGEDNSWEDEDVESRAAIERVLKKYAKAPVFDDDEDGGFDGREEKRLKDKMDEWKRTYYKDKLEFSYDSPEDLGKLIFRYVEGLQWVMHYYYGGVASWGWFYDYHYAPRISDFKGVDKMTFNFDLGEPFKPYEQLMGVLPLASKEHIPEAYQDLMYSPNSPILDFYPTEFEQDMNGKKAEWEAIVKIPFINADRLKKAMASREHRLSAAERQRNESGTSTRFMFDGGREPSFYPSSLPGFFPAITRCLCKMEVFNLPILHPIEERPIEGVPLMAGFPSLRTLTTNAVLGFHGVNVHGSESRNKSMVLHVKTTGNPYYHGPEVNVKRATQDLIGARVFVGWPFLKEGIVVGLSDGMFKYEKVAVVQGAKERVVSNPHNGGWWRGKAERIETMYSKKFGVVIGEVEVLVHIRMLKGLKRIESGALVKDYEGADKETEAALQMVLPKSASAEDPRYAEKPAPPIAEEFPDGSRIFFLGEHAYGVAAQVSATTDDTMSVILAFFPSDKTENATFTEIVNSRQSSSERYFPAYEAAQMAGMSGRALSKITSSFMVLTPDGQKHNLGLCLKYEVKAMKVVGYSRKEREGERERRYGGGPGGRGGWEFSEKAIKLIKEYKLKYPEVFKSLDGGGDAMARASDVLGEDAEARLKEIKSWLKAQGVRDFEPVSLFCDQLSKDVVREIETKADEFNKSRTTAAGMKKALVKGIPRQAVLKPVHAPYRLQNQVFALGDRVIMVANASGGVPLAAKGVVIGLSNGRTMDVLWDQPFMAGGTLGDRCSQYRGSSVELESCLNLTNPQFVASTKPSEPPPPPRVNPNAPPFKPRFAGRPSGLDVDGAPGFRSAPPHRGGYMNGVNQRGGYPAPKPAFSPTQPKPPFAILTNPNSNSGRGRGRGVPPPQPGMGRGMDAPPSSPGMGRGVGRGMRGRGRGRGLVQTQTQTAAS